MKVKTLKKILYEICCAGYADWEPNFCDEDGDYYTINHIYLDDDSDVCIESTDMEGPGNYDFTAANILHRLKYYDSDSYVYFWRNRRSSRYRRASFQERMRAGKRSAMRSRGVIHPVTAVTSC